MFLSVQQAEFYNTEEKLQHTQTPTTTMTTSLNNRAKESVANLLKMCPLTSASTINMPQ